MLSHIRTVSLWAGPVFVVAYAFGLVSVSKFLGSYGLQATELLRARYLSIGLSAIVLTTPTVLCLSSACSLARRQPPAGEKKWLRWVLVAFVAVWCGLATCGTWLFWSGILTAFDRASTPGLPTTYCLTMGIGAAVFSLMPFWFRGVTDKTWIPLMTVFWSLLVCTTLASVLRYMPPWAGGYSTRPVTVIMREADLQEFVSRELIVVEATADRYIFWDVPLDRLIEVPRDSVRAIIATRGEGDGR